MVQLLPLLLIQFFCRSFKLIAYESVKGFINILVRFDDLTQKRWFTGWNQLETIGRICQEDHHNQKMNHSWTDGGDVFTKV
jgi:hypothetical protein